MTASPPAGLHWHAYAYTGPRGYIPDHEQEAPLDSAIWPMRPAREIVATLEEPEDAEAWMRQQLRLNLPAEAEHGHASAALYLRQQLYIEQHEVPWATYIDRHGRYPWSAAAESAPLGRPGFPARWLIAPAPSWGCVPARRAYQLHPRCAGIDPNCTACGGLPD
ncbi:hypothetical protein [Streptomyces sp. NBC_00091]|uniref:hypothetical protein n=1 Tax=Streptomyces sp. NBC_00091 TaxID=2975648 RepID=UPI002259E815|nr:hypothetical protein [Streptomyces sp. NBC_00091]MCX5381367.1 hypothetical protein [Streptomyces sp. NBC_00091]